MLIWSPLIWDWYLLIGILDVIKLEFMENQEILFHRTWTNGSLTLEEAFDEASQNLIDARTGKDQGSTCVVMELVQKQDFRIRIVLSLYRYFIASELENLLSGYHKYF